MFRSIALILSILFLPFFVGCGDDASGQPQEGIPPVVTINSPQNGAVIEAASVTLTGEVLVEDGYELAEVVYRIDGGAPVEITSVANGSFQVELTDLPRGRNLRIGVGAADNRGLAGSDEVTIRLETDSPTPAQLRLVASPTEIEVGGSSEVTVTVEDSNGSAISGIEVTLQASAGSIPSTAMTGVDGQTTVTYSAGQQAGMVTISARVAALEESVNITVIEADDETPAALALSADPDSVPIGETSQITASVTNSGGDPLEGIEVSFAADVGMIDGQATTDAQGLATLVYTAPQEVTTATITASVDALEETLELPITPVPVTYTWVGGVGDWDVPQNWDPEGVPGPFDTAIVASGTAQMNTGEEIVVANLELSAGIEGNDDLRVTNTLTFSAGFIGSGGDLTIPQGATLHYTSSSAREISRDVRNHGTFHHDTTAALRLTDDVTFHNDGVYEATNTGNIQGAASTADAATFINNGTFRKESAGEVRLINALIFQNDGLVEIVEGDLEFRTDASTETHTGTFEIADGAQWVLNAAGVSDTTFADGSAVRGDGGFRIAGSHSATFEAGSQLAVKSPGLVDGVFGTPALTIETTDYDVSEGFDLLRGGLFFDNGEEARLYDVDSDSVQITQLGAPDGVVVMDGSTFWMGRLHILPGTTLRVADGATLEYVSMLGRNALIEGTLANEGLMRWTGGAYIQLEDGASIVNDGTLEVAAATNLRTPNVGTIQALFENLGDLVVETGLSFTNRMEFRNAGNVTIDNGGLFDVAASTGIEHTQSGTFVIDGEFFCSGFSSDPVFVFEPSSSVMGIGSLTFETGCPARLEGSTDFGGELSVTTSLAFAAGSTTQLGSVTLDGGGLTVSADTEIRGDLFGDGTISLNDSTLRFRATNEQNLIEADSLTISGDANTGVIFDSSVINSDIQISVGSVTVTAGTTLNNTGSIAGTICTIDGTVNQNPLNCN